MNNYSFGKMFLKNSLNLLLIIFALLMLTVFQRHNIIKILIYLYIVATSTVMFTVNFYHCVLNGLIRKEKNFGYCIINILFATAYFIIMIPAYNFNLELLVYFGGFVFAVGALYGFYEIDKKNGF
jgi:hypothetical protein